MNIYWRTGQHFMSSECSQLFCVALVCFVILPGYAYDDGVGPEQSVLKLEKGRSLGLHCHFPGLKQCPPMTLYEWILCRLAYTSPPALGEDVWGTRRGGNLDMVPFETDMTCPEWTATRVQFCGMRMRQLEPGIASSPSNHLPRTISDFSS